METNNQQCIDCNEYHDLGKCLKSTYISGLPPITSLDLEKKLCNKCDTIVSEIETHNCDTGDIESYHIDERERRRLYNGMPMGFTYMDYLCLGDQLNKGFVVVDDREISQEQFPEFFKMLKKSGRSDLRNSTCLKLSDIIKPGRIPVTTGGKLDMECGECRGDADGTITMGCEHIPRCANKASVKPERHGHEITQNLTIPIEDCGLAPTTVTIDADEDPDGIAVLQPADPLPEVCVITEDTKSVEVDGQTDDVRLSVEVEHQVGISNGGNPKPIDILPPVQAGCMMIKISLDPICDGIKQLDPCNDCK